MRPIILLITSGLIISTLVACAGIYKTSQNIAVYDFGLSAPSESNQQITSKLLIEAPITAEFLNHNKIRYRLSYLNPSRVFFYTESHWAATPLELFSSKLSKMVNLTKTPKNCSLKLKIEAFDHVFQTITTSEGIVQLSALVVQSKTQKIISGQLITESVMSVTPNAQGGTVAISQATENALKKAIDWGNVIADNSELCQ
jgi:cholesterol transport system auxiliary component